MPIDRRCRRLLPLLACAAALTGCASVLNDTAQPMRVETWSSAGEPVPGASCRLVNDFGSVGVTSRDTAWVRRSSGNLTIACTHPDHPPAHALAVSRWNAAMAGNLLVGGGVGALVDHGRGTGYTYPTWVQLEFGRTLVFDRDAQPGSRPALAFDRTAAR